MVRCAGSDRGGKARPSSGDVAGLSVFYDSLETGAKVYGSNRDICTCTPNARSISPLLPSGHERHPRPDAAEPELRLGLVNNPILSPKSVEAAKIELALSRLGRPEAVYDFHRHLFERRGTIDGATAMEVADELGAPRAEVEKLAASLDVQATLLAQTSLAASLGMATPSFLVAGTGILGYPGPKTLKRIVDSVRWCDRIVC